MGGYKGVGVLFVRRLLRESGPGIESAVKAALSEGERDLYDACTAGSWVPIEFVTKLAVEAAPRLFPAEDKPLDALGRALAVDNFSGVYAFMVRVMTVEFIVKQSARLWRLYHDAGRAQTRALGASELAYDIFEYADMPEDFRHYGAGFIAKLIEMTGAGDVVVEPRPLDGGDWGYRITWAD